MLRRLAAGFRSQAGAIRRRASRGSRLLGSWGLAGMPLARQYLLLSLVFVIIGGGIVAYALGQVIETSAISRTTSVTALYVESFVAPDLQSLASSPTLTPTEIDSLQRLLTNSPLGQKVVSFRIWSTDGRILYSPVAALIGPPVRHERGAGRGCAWSGHRRHQ